MIEPQYKYDYVKQYIANYLCGLNVGDRLFTYDDFSQILNVGRGTIQQALHELSEDGCIEYSNHGRNGRIINKLEYEKLISESGKQMIIGVMPLPYSKRYDGLATGVISMLNAGGILSNMAFMNGSENRVELLKSGRYDFCIVSYRTALETVEKDDSVMISNVFQEQTFMDDFVLITKLQQDELNKVKKVGVDYSSKDQVFATLSHFKNTDIQLVPIEYPNLTDSILNESIDAAIWSSQNLKLPHDVNTYTILKNSGSVKHTQAAVLCMKENHAISRYLRINLDREEVRKIQNKVISGQRIASY